MGQNYDVVARFWSAFEAGDVDLASKTFAADSVFAQPGMPEMRGPEALGMMLAGWRAAFPDLRHEVEEVVEAGETVAVRLRVRGTHHGPLRLPDGRELEPTGQEVVWDSVDWIKVRDGKVASWHVYQDSAQFMATLGLLPEPAAG